MNSAEKKGIPVASLGVWDENKKTVRRIEIAL